MSSAADVLEILSAKENFRTWTFERPSELPPWDGKTPRSPKYPLLAEGPWNDEPDKVQWIDDLTGYDCLILRNRMGALCGYVGIPPEHPWFEKDYSQCVKGDCGDYCDHTPESQLDVHGGLTFANTCSPGEPEEGICHVAGPGRPEVWWFGFDCAHGGDLAPGMAEWERQQGFPDYRDRDVYRDLDYVVSQIVGLALQLKKVEQDGS